MHGDTARTGTDETNMTIVGFLASTRRAAFFCDSAGYVMKRIRRWNRYEEMAEDVHWIRSNNHSKFNPVTRNAVVFQLDRFLNPKSLDVGKDASTLEVAQAVGEYAKKCLEPHPFHRSMFTAFVIAYGKITLAPDEPRKGIVAYIIDVTKERLDSYAEDQRFSPFQPAHLGLPSFWISITTDDAYSVLWDFLFSDVDTANYDAWMDSTITKFLKKGYDILDEITRKYPCFMHPIRIAKLDKNGFRWIRNKPRAKTPLPPKGSINIFG